MTALTGKIDDASGSMIQEAKLKYKLHWVCPYPTPYFSQLFCALASAPDIDLTVHYRVRSFASHPWRTNLAIGYQSRQYHCVFGVDWHLLYLGLADKSAVFVIWGWEHVTVIVLSALLGLMGGKYVIGTDTPNLTRRRNPLFAFLRVCWLKWVFSRAHKVMGTGRPGVDGLRKMGVPAYKIVNFPYFIDVATYVSRWTAPLAKVAHLPIRFISSGRLINALKGYDIALRALAEAFNKTGIEFEYLIAGTGPDEGSLKQLAERLVIGDRVRFLGWLEQDELMRCFDSAHVLIHASPIHEPFGVAVLEAMAMGLPILASDVTCAALDRVKSGVNGFIHPAGDEHTLASQIMLFLNNPELIPQMGKAARKTAEEWPVGRGVEIIECSILDAGSNYARD